MEARWRLCGFSAALERLLAARDAAAFEAEWIAQDLQQLGWEALALARRANTEALEPVLAEVDQRLLAVLERCRAFVDSHVVTFRVPELERWQHASAAISCGAASSAPRSSNRCSCWEMRQPCRCSRSCW